MRIEQRSENREVLVLNLALEFLRSNESSLYSLFSLLYSNKSGKGTAIIEFSIIYALELKGI